MGLAPFEESRAYTCFLIGREREGELIGFFKQLEVRLVTGMRVPVGGACACLCVCARVCVLLLPRRCPAGVPRVGWDAEREARDWPVCVFMCLGARARPGKGGCAVASSEPYPSIHKALGRPHPQ